LIHKPPTANCRSIEMAFKPAFKRFLSETTPAGPAPMTMASKGCCFVVGTKSAGIAGIGGLTGRVLRVGAEATWEWRPFLKGCSMLFCPNY